MSNGIQLVMQQNVILKNLKYFHSDSALKLNQRRPSGDSNAKDLWIFAYKWPVRTKWPTSVSVVITVGK